MAAKSSKKASGPKLSRHEQALRSSSLETDCVRSELAVDKAVSDESMRRLQARIQILQNSNDKLGDDLNELKGQLGELTTENGAMEERLEQMEREALGLNKLKVELDSLRADSGSRDDLARRELALSSQVSTLETKVHHYESLEHEHQANLADKLALQAKVNSLTAALEAQEAAEKGAASKQATQLKSQLTAATAAKNAAEAELAAKTTQLSSVEADLEREKRRRETAEKAVAQANADWETEKSVMSDRLAASRDKLRVAKEQLKETQAQLVDVRATTSAVAKTSKARKGGGGSSSAAPSSSAPEGRDPDATIGTPGDGPAKRTRKPIQASVAALGDKSAFSMTPFLDRTRTTAAGLGSKLATAVPVGSGRDNQVDEEQEDSLMDAIMAADASRVGTSSMMLSLAGNDVDGPGRTGNTTVEDARSRRGGSVMADLSSTKSNIVAGAKPKPKTALAKKKALGTFGILGRGTEAVVDVAPALATKRKRKLGGAARTLFDDEDDEDGDDAGRPVTKKKVLLAKKKQAAGAGRQTVVMDDGFEFSPLRKKGRR